jgi:hypothetical protein
MIRCPKKTITPDKQRSSAQQQNELLGVEGRDGVLPLIRKLTKRGHGLYD